jgi:hypothetical protein
MLLSIKAKVVKCSTYLILGLYIGEAQITSVEIHTVQP